MRLIDADVLDELIVESYHMTEHEDVKVGYSIVRLLMDKVPTIDAVEVVRCKDCQNWIRGSCYVEGWSVEADDYCSWGVIPKDQQVTGKLPASEEEE